jgi:hypothetical protein
MRTVWRGLILAAVLGTTVLPGRVKAQSDSNSSAPAASQPATVTNAELLDELRKLKAEVAETRQLKDQVTQLQNEVYNLRSSGLAPANRDFASVVGGEAASSSGPPLAAPLAPRSPGETMTSHTLDTGGSRDDTLTDMFPLGFRYR